MSARDKVRETERQTDTERQRACMHAYNDFTHVYM